MKREFFSMIVSFKCGNTCNTTETVITRDALRDIQGITVDSCIHGCSLKRLKWREDHVDTHDYYEMGREESFLRDVLGDSRRNHPHQRHPNQRK
jgi:hypothetical protein